MNDVESTKVDQHKYGVIAKNGTGESYRSGTANYS
jgi:hypothetical protein